MKGMIFLSRSRIRTTIDFETDTFDWLADYATRNRISRNRVVEEALQMLRDATQRDATQSDSKRNNAIIGTWWNDNKIDLVKIQNDVFALHGWNGESYTASWKVTGEHLTIASKEKYDIAPITIQRSEDEFEIIGYEVKRN
jgi:hypothetical protein